MAFNLRSRVAWARLNLPVILMVGGAIFALVGLLDLFDLRRRDRRMLVGISAIGAASGLALMLVRKLGERAWRSPVMAVALLAIALVVVALLLSDPYAR